MYVSVHATEQHVRNFLLGRRTSRDIMETLRVLADAGITLHTQVVLCPGINDGKVLENWFAVRVAINICVTFVVWVSVTLLTSRRPCPQTTAFHERMRIAGPGWRRVARETGIPSQPGELRRAATGWIASLLLLFGLLLGIGSLIFHNWTAAIVCGALAAAGGLVLQRELRRIRLLDSLRAALAFVRFFDRQRHVLLPEIAANDGNIRYGACYR